VVLHPPLSPARAGLVGEERRGGMKGEGGGRESTCRGETQIYINEEKIGNFDVSN
jgi:hypothetical protein